MTTILTTVSTAATKTDVVRASMTATVIVMNTGSDNKNIIVIISLTKVNKQ